MVTITSLLQNLVKLNCIFGKCIVRGEIGTTTKPPNRASFEVAIVEMNRGYIWVTGMEHQRGAGCKKGMSSGFGALG